MDLPSPSTRRSFVVKAKPGSRADEILSWDGKVLQVAIAAPADKNKANVRLVKFLSKELHHPVRLKSGASSKEKLFCFV
jgi:uncharacterized protein (TIGR00251 family)